MAEEYIFNEPKSGEELAIEAAPGQSLQFTFFIENCSAEILEESGDLLITADNGGVIRIKGFAMIAENDLPLIILQDGTIIEGSSLVAALVHPVELEPGLSAAGPEFSDGLAGTAFVSDADFVASSLLADDAQLDRHLADSMRDSCKTEFEVWSPDGMNSHAERGITCVAKLGSEAGMDAAIEPLSHHAIATKSDVITIEEILASNADKIHVAGHEVKTDSFEGLMHLLADKGETSREPGMSAAPEVAQSPFFDSLTYQEKIDAHDHEAAIRKALMDFIA